MDEYTPEHRVIDAMSGIVAQTARQIATRAGVPMATAQKVIRRLVAVGDLEQRGKRYRIVNAMQWVECREDLPPLGVPCRLEFDSSRRGYKVTLLKRTEPKEAPAKPQAPSRPRAMPEGQISLFVRCS